MREAVNDFHEYSKQIVKDFIQNVVIIDDQIYNQSNEVVTDNDKKQIAASPLAQLAASQSFKKAEVIEQQETLKNIEKQTYQIDVPLLTNTFAEEGILCSCIEPKINHNGFESEQQKTDITNQLFRVLSKSDIVILDWQTYNDDKKGELTCELLKKLKQESFKLRLIAIYTGENIEKNVLPEIFKIFENQAKEDLRKSEGTLSHDAIIIKFLLKKDSIYNFDDLGIKKVGEEEIPNICINEFAKTSEGLLSNAVLSAITSIRNNTFGIISQFPAEYDANYINHRINLPSPNDAKGFMYQIISDEIIASIDFDRIDECINIESIKKFVDGLNKNEFTINGTTLDCSSIKELIEIGKRSYKDKYKDASFSKNKHLPAAKLFMRQSLSDEQIDELACNFSALTMTNTRYFSANRLPYLTLGTIITLHKENNDKCEKKENCFISCNCHNKKDYYLCIQPRCDSIRQKEEFLLLFIPLTIINGKQEKEKINISIYDLEKRQNLILGCSSLTKAVVKKFKFNKDCDRVVAKEEDGKFLFEVENGDIYRWVTELKFTFAQKVIEELSNNLSRVGVDEYEWFRYNYDKEDL